MLEHSSLKNKILTYFFFLIINISSSNAASNEPVQLNKHNNVERFRIGPNSQYVVFNEFDETNNLQRYSIKINGQSDNIKIGENVDLESRIRFWISEPNARVLSRINNPINGNEEFLSIPINGGASTFLSPPTPTTEGVNSISIRGTDNIAAFDTFSGDLYSIPVDGSTTANNLSEIIDPDNNINIGRLRRTPDGSIIVFDAKLDAVNENALFSVHSDGSSNPIQLSTLSFSLVNNFKISEDQSMVIYVEETGFNDTFQQQLFSVPIDGSSPPTALTDLIIGDFEDIDLVISQDSTQVVYSIVDELTNEVKLFSVSSNGNSNPQLIDEGIELHQFEITNNNEFIIYSITKSFPDNPFVSEPNIPVLLRSSLIPEDNNEPTLLSTLGFDTFIGIAETTPNRINPDVRFEVTSDSQFVYFIQDFSGDFLSVDLVPHLLKVTINNPISRIQINDNSIGTLSTILPSSVESFVLSNNEQSIIYQVGGILTAASQLARASANGDNNELLPTLSVGNINEFEISNDDEFIVFTTDSEFNNTENLYSIRLSEPEPLCFPIKNKNDNFVIICL